MKNTRRLLMSATALLMLAAMLLSSCRHTENTGQTEDPTSENHATTNTDNTEETEQPMKEQRPAMQIKNYGIIDYRAGDGLLYNGIELPQSWPPKTVDPMTDVPYTMPYLLSEEEGGYRPEVIDITVGRQLFVDNFLIEETDLETVYHSAEKYEGNPILKGTAKNEIDNGWSNVGTSAGGVWYDMQEGIYKMWYDVGFNNAVGYCVSFDGINWQRVDVDGTGSNIVMDKNEKYGTCSVFIDYEADPSEKYKMFVQNFNNEFQNGEDGHFIIPGTVDEHNYAHTLYVSSDGIHWTQKGGLSNGLSGDMTTAFYNAFTHKWINSLRSYAKTFYKGKEFVGRVRYYAESDTFEGMLDWKEDDVVFWLKCDNRDEVDPASGVSPQMYNFSAIAYESIMIGSYTIWRGPENNIIEKTGNPKINEIQAAYSRDGFNYDRPERTPLISASRVDGSWDKGYLFSSIGGMIVHDDNIYIYYSGFSGHKYFNGPEKDAHASQSIGIAVIRRDGFASLEGKGELLTRKLCTSNDKKYLFVNIDCPENSFRAEILDENGNTVEGFSMDECIAVGGDDTCKMITWKNGEDLSFLNDMNFRIRFSMEQDGKLYSFWLSDSVNGESDGAVAAGYVQ